MKNIRNSRLPNLTTIIAAIALFVVLGGTATAAKGLINGNKIKPRTVTAKQIKNKSITRAKLAPGTVNALRGPRGAKGDTGAKGDKGEQGIPGPQGIPGTNDLTTFSAGQSANNVPANTDVDVLSFNGLQSSKYLVIAKSIMFAQSAGAFLRCSIETSNGADGDEAQWTSPGVNTRTTVPLVLSTTAKVTQIKVKCNPGSSIGSFNVDAVLVPIA